MSKLKWIIIFLNLFVFITSFGQDTIQSQSLKKYSYTIMGVSKKSVSDFGTCFFITFKNDLYLVTAKHTLYTCDTIALKEYPEFQQAIVFIPEPFKVVQLEIPQISDTCLGFERDPDVFVMKVDASLFKNVFTVDQFLLPPFEKLGELNIFGQGMKIDSQFVGFDSQHHINIPRNSFEIYSSHGLSNGGIDSMHYLIELDNLKVGNWLKGFSGSPVFLQDWVSKKWRVCGMLTKGLYTNSNESKDAILSVKSDFILNFIDNVRKY